MNVKNKSFLIFLLLLLMIPLAAGAESEQEWVESATHRTTRDTTIYEWKRITTVATSGDMAYNEYTDIFTPDGMIPAGTYIIVTSSEIEGKRDIIGYRNGKTYIGWIDQTAYTSVEITVRGSDGKLYRIPEAAYQNYEAIKRRYGDVYDEDTLRIIAEAERVWGKSDSASAGMSSTFALTYTDESDEPYRVELVTLGSAYSVVLLDNEECTVPTVRLSWNADTDETQRIAAIDAKRTGKATMRSKSGGKGSVIKKVDTNQLALVLSVKGKYARIRVEGKEGYVLTSALAFLPVINVEDEEAAALQTGFLSYKGNVKSRQAINARSSGTRNARVVTEMRSGTPVVIFGIEDGWAEIEADGYRVFVLTEYLTIE